MLTFGNEQIIVRNHLIFQSVGGTSKDFEVKAIDQPFLWP